ncbi:MAG: LytTR family DNA-binding domain-containing protein [Gemmatimonadales bacterium]|jgi:two-component system LytT family response regulator
MMPSDDVRILIVDDEAPARDAARLALAAMQGVSIAGECGSAADAIEAIRELDPDLVLLDVQMPDADGFDVIEGVGTDIMPPVIFVTAYDQHALRAFEVHAVDYVLKPYSDARLRSAVERACRWIAAGEATWRSTIRSLVADLSSGAYGRVARRIMVREGDRIRFVPTERIDWIEASRNYMKLHVGERVFEVRTTLKALLERLDAARFVQIHRSTIVNVDRISEVQPWFGGDYIALLADGEKLKVSRTYRENLLRPTL